MEYGINAVQLVGKERGEVNGVLAAGEVVGGGDGGEYGGGEGGVGEGEGGG